MLAEMRSSSPACEACMAELTTALTAALREKWLGYALIGIAVAIIGLILKIEKSRGNHGPIRVRRYTGHDCFRWPESSERLCAEQNVFLIQLCGESRGLPAR